MSHLIKEAGLQSLHLQLRFGSESHMASPTPTSVPSIASSRPMLRAKHRFTSAAARLQESLRDNDLKALLVNVGTAIESPESLQTAAETLEQAIAKLLDKNQSTISSSRHATTKDIVRRLFRVSYPFARNLLTISQGASQVLLPVNASGNDRSRSSTLMD
jgi:hypothetical protein